VGSNSILECKIMFKTKHHASWAGMLLMIIVSSNIRPPSNGYIGNKLNNIKQSCMLNRSVLQCCEIMHRGTGKRRNHPRGMVL
jgi:hypothetical protein